MPSLGHTEGLMGPRSSDRDPVWMRDTMVPHRLAKTSPIDTVLKEGEFWCGGGEFVKVLYYRSCTALSNNRRWLIPSNVSTLMYLSVSGSRMSNSFVRSCTTLFFAGHVVSDPHVELSIVPCPWSED
eukprot:scaffold502_cov350-Pavlova_lutheri.AAC.8